MGQGVCVLCGYIGEVCYCEKRTDVLICLSCFIKFYCDTNIEKEDKLSWDDVAGRSGGKDPDVVNIVPNTTKLVHVLLPDVDEPVSYWTHYIPSRVASNKAKGRVIICPGKDICPACEIATFRTKRVHAINVWDYETKAVKILEGGNSIFQALKQIKDQLGTLANVDISIKRIGDGKNTEYSTIPIPMMQPFDNTQVHGLFPIANLRLANTIEEVHRVMNEMDGGVAVDVRQPAITQEVIQNIKTAPIVALRPDIAHPTTLQFGKYKGRTVADIYIEDPNYVKWCAENISDPNIKNEAKRVIAQHIKDTSAPSTVLSEVTNKQVMINEINEILQLDERYKGNFALILEKMRTASISPTHPGGKTILSDYELPELQKLLESIK